MSKEEKSHLAYEYGTDADYLDWLSYQPSCLDGTWNQWDHDQDCGRNIACHVRRQSRGAGYGIKPPFSAVPLTDAQHKVQSLKGELRALIRYTYYIGYTDQMASEWFEQQANFHLNNWIEEIKQKKGTK